MAQLQTAIFRLLDGIEWLLGILSPRSSTQNNEKTMIIKNYLCCSSITENHVSFGIRTCFSSFMRETENRTNGNESISCPAAREDFSVNIRKWNVTEIIIIFGRNINRCNLHGAGFVYVMQLKAGELLLWASVYLHEREPNWFPQTRARLAME